MRDDIDCTFLQNVCVLVLTQNKVDGEAVFFISLFEELENFFAISSMEQESWLQTNITVTFDVTNFESDVFFVCFLFMVEIYVSDATANEFLVKRVHY
jgi:hypothetical protein